jgi:glycosyltransferase involved in cell wall biosynthesis
MNNIVKELRIDDTYLPTLSVCMIVKNEEQGLSKLLPNLVGVVDEVIIIDTGSTDNTVNIAKQYGAKVFNFEWCDDFSKARNESLKYATKEYILWLDGDDYVDKMDFSKLKIHISQNPNKGYFVRLIDFRNNTVYESMQLRAFPNIKGLEFRGKIHEQISFSLEDHKIDFSHVDFKVEHHGYVDEATILIKLERNYKVVLEELKVNPDDFVILMNAARTALSMGKVAIGEVFIDEAIKLFNEGKQKVTKEHALMAFMTKATLYGHSGRDKEALRLLESQRNKFQGLYLLRLAIGEINFKLKKYSEAYKDLIIIRDGKLSITNYPIDATSALSNYNKYLLACSLVVKDYRTAGMCMGRMINDTEYKL